MNPFRLLSGREREVAEPSAESKGMLIALQRRAMPIYGGTVTPKVIARRRAASKAARVSRRINRKG